MSCLAQLPAIPCRTYRRKIILLPGPTALATAPFPPSLALMQVTSGESTSARNQRPPPRPHGFERPPHTTPHCCTGSAHQGLQGKQHNALMTFLLCSTKVIGCGQALHALACSSAWNYRSAGRRTSQRGLWTPLTNGRHQRGWDPERRAASPSAEHRTVRYRPRPACCCRPSSAQMPKHTAGINSMIVLCSSCILAAWEPQPPGKTITGEQRLSSRGKRPRTTYMGPGCCGSHSCSPPL